MNWLDNIFGPCESCLVRPATRLVHLGGGLFCVCAECAPPAPARVAPRSPAYRAGERVGVFAGFAVSALLMVTSLVLIGRWALRLLGVL